MPDAVVIGAGPNGLVAANRLADHGWSVLVVEAADEPGGAVRSAELTEPGFVHDVFSAFYPLAVFSPAIAGLGLERYGLRWLHGPLVLAHPAADGSCAVISRTLDETAASLDAFAAGDGDAWRRLYDLYRRMTPHLGSALVTPLPPLVPVARIAASLRGDLLRVARLGLLPVRRLAEEEFSGEGAARLLAGNALHTDLAPETPPSGFFGWFLCSLGQDVGFPVPEGGAGRLTEALVRRLEAAGGEVRCGARAERVLVRDGRATGVRLAGGETVEASRAVLADVTAPALYLDLLDPEHVPPRVREHIERRYQLDSATYKVDWALDGPIPWTAPQARLAPVVHVSDRVDEMTASCAEIARGLIPAQPFLVCGQYSMVDPSRCPPGKEVAWAYAHVPQTVRGDAGGSLTGTWDRDEGEAFAERVEARVEVLAPGFRKLIRARHVLTPRDFEERDANLVGGAVNGGTAQLHQQLFFRLPTSFGRPTTPVRGLYLASASVHPGGGVHGGPGAIAARAARRRRPLQALRALASNALPRHGK